MSRELYLLHNKLEKLCKEHRHQCLQHGIELLITCTYREPRLQSGLIAAGRSNAKISWHNFKPALAYDFVPVFSGKADYAVWKPKNVPDGEVVVYKIIDDELTNERHVGWEKIIVLAKGLGLHCGYFWKKTDMPHAEWHPSYDDDEQARAFNDWEGYEVSKDYGESINGDRMDSNFDFGDCGCVPRGDVVEPSVPEQKED